MPEQDDSRSDKQRLKDIMQDVDALDLPDGAHWAMIEERFGSDPFDLIMLDPDFFRWSEEN